MYLLWFLNFDRIQFTVNRNQAKILITGANGYLGSNLGYQLVQGGLNVRFTDHAPKSILQGVDYRSCDFLDKNQIEDVIEGVDIIYFFTGRTGNSAAGYDLAAEFVMGNEITLLNLLNVIRNKDKKPKIIFPSTRLIYEGGKDYPINETGNLNPKSIYAVNKWACEAYLQLYRENFGIDYTIFRVSLPYGSNIPMEHVSYGVMAYLVNRAKRGETLSVFGDGDQYVSLVHINDLSEILIQGGLHPSTNGHIYNIGGPDAMRMKDVLEAISRVFNVELRNEQWPTIIRNADQGSLIISSDEIVNLLNYTYEYNFNSWLNRIDR